MPGRLSTPMTAPARASARASAMMTSSDMSDLLDVTLWLLANGYVLQSRRVEVTCQVRYTGYVMSLNHDTVPEPNHSEELFVAFANTLEFERGEPVDALPDADALLGWLRDRALISDRARAVEIGRLVHDGAEAERRMERFRHLRRLLHDIADSVDRRGRPSRVQVRELNHILRHGLHYHELRLDDDGTRYAFAQVGDRLDQARATIASSLAHFLADDDASRLRTCANPGCRFVFVDRSPAGRRRWCDMRTCGNQAKVARHRARAKHDASRGAEGLTPAR